LLGDYPEENTEGNGYKTSSKYGAENGADEEQEGSMAPTIEAKGLKKAGDTMVEMQHQYGYRQDVKAANPGRAKTGDQHRVNFVLSQGSKFGMGETKGKMS
jgi:hypothetical protein